VINVLGSAFTSGCTASSSWAPRPDKCSGNFSSANRGAPAQAALDWRGTMLAPKADVSVSNGQFYGQIFADTVTVGGELVHHVPYTGCLAPLATAPGAAAEHLAEVAVHRSGDQAPRAGADQQRPDRLRGPLGGHRLRAERHAARSGQEGHLLRQSRGATSPITSSPPRAQTTVEATTGINKCGGSIVIGKAVTGEGIPPPGPVGDPRRGRQLVLADRHRSSPERRRR
jgi:hypothetical protein